jgi:hypothetical protein
MDEQKVQGTHPSQPTDYVYGSVTAGRTRQHDNPTNYGLFLHRPESTEERLILDFNLTACCSTGTGLNEDDCRTVPVLLAKRGVTVEEWKRFVDRLAEIQSHQWSMTAYVLSIVLVLCTPILCCVQARYHKHMRVWLDDLNREVMMPRGMFAKFQTNSVHSDKYHESISWLAVALTEEESAILREEVIFWSPGCCDQTIRPACCACACCTCCCCVPCVM